jgi:hypothetical protein
MLIRRASRPRGQAAKKDAGLLGAAEVATALTLRHPLGLDWDVSSTEVVRRILKASRGGTDPAEAFWPSMDDLRNTPAARSVTLVRRGFIEVFQEIHREWRQELFDAEETPEAARAAARAGTFSKLVASDGYDSRMIFDAIWYGIKAGSMLHDWLNVGSVTEELAQAASSGLVRSTLQSLLALGTDEDAFEKLFGDLRVHGRRPMWGAGTDHRYLELSGSVYRTANLPLRSNRVTPDLNTYDLFTLLGVGLLWHVMDAHLPHIGSMQAKRSIGSPGTVLATFPGGQQLVLLSDLRSVMVEGELHGLCLRHRSTAANDYLRTGRILSLREADGHILATLAFRRAQDGKLKKREVKGAQNAPESSLAPAVKILLDSIWRTRSFNGTISIPAVAARLPSLAIQWTPAGNSLFVHTPRIEHGVATSTLTSGLVEGLSETEQIEVYRSLEATKQTLLAGDRDDYAVNRVLQNIRDRLPYNVLILGSRNLRLPGVGVVKAEGPIAEARVLTIIPRPASAGSRITQRSHPILYQVCEALQHLSVHGRKMEHVERRAGFDMDLTDTRILSRDLFAHDTKRKWRGMWRNKITVDIDTGWIESTSWGRTSHYKSGGRNWKPGGSIRLHPSRLVVAEQISKTVTFIGKFEGARVRIKGDTYPTAKFTVSGSIEVRVQRRGAARAENLEPLVERWQAWVDSRVRQQQKAILPFLTAYLPQTTAQLRAPLIHGISDAPLDSMLVRKVRARLQDVSYAHANAVGEAVEKLKQVRASARKVSANLRRFDRGTKKGQRAKLVTPMPPEMQRRLGIRALLRDLYA